MQEFFYAQTNDEHIVIGVTHAAAFIEGAHMVPIESMDTTLIGQRWNPEAKAFEPSPPPAVPTERNVSRKAFLSRFTDAEAIDTATAQWMTWGIGRTTSRQHGIPRGLPYLTGFVAHCGIAQAA